MDAFSLQDKAGKELMVMDTSFLSQKHLYAPHSHSKLEMSLAKSGKGLYWIDGREYDIQTNDVFIINNQEVHNIVMEDKHKLVNTVLHFDVEFLWDLLGESPDYRLLDVFFAHGERYSHRLDRANPVTREVVELFTEIEMEMINQPPYYDLQVKGLMKMMFIKILRNYPYFDTEKRHDLEKITTSEAFKTKEVLRHIEQNISNDLSLSELAQVACLSPTYFSLLFKRYNGITVTEYITKKRIEHAVRLIRDTKLSLTEIGQRCGFNNSTSFYKAFKRTTGETPSYYRKNPHIIYNGI